MLVSYREAVKKGGGGVLKRDFLEKKEANSVKYGRGGRAVRGRRVDAGGVGLDPPTLHRQRHRLRPRKTATEERKGGIIVKESAACRTKAKYIARDNERIVGTWEGAILTIGERPPSRKRREQEGTE